MPHVARTVIEREIPNEHGTPIRYQVKQSRNRKQWWVSASLHGHRMSNTIGTGNADVAERWIKAIERGTVCVDGSD